MATLFGAFGLADVPSESILDVGFDRITPIHADRTIDLYNLQARWRRKQFDGWPVTLSMGLTASRAVGSITQLTGSYAAGTLRTEVLDSPAWGIGPAVDARADLLRGARWSLGLDASAALMLWDRPFPAGGLRYDGLFQFGPSVDWTFVDGSQFRIGLHWTHLSNGHGITPSNPSHEGRSLAIRYLFPLRR